MLVLSRRESEKIRINDDITITVVRVSGNKVRIGIEAPDHYRIMRGELIAEEDERHLSLSGSSFDIPTFN